MISVNTHEAKTRLSELLSRVESRQEPIVICRQGPRVVELIPWGRSRNPLLTSPRLKKVKFIEDPSLPLSEEEWPKALR